MWLSTLWILTLLSWFASAILVIFLVGALLYARGYRQMYLDLVEKERKRTPVSSLQDWMDNEPDLYSDEDGEPV